MSQGALRRAAGFLRAAHPFPTAMVLGLTGLIGLATAGSGLDASRIGLMLAAMLLSQLAIGWTNDYMDRETDRRFQPEKPIPSGEVEAPLLPPAILLAVIGSLAIGFLLGPQALVLLAIGTAAGLSYDFGLKATQLSWVPYLIGFAVLPLFVWSALDTFRGELLWLYPLGIPLVLAVHTANVLPDIESDRKAGRFSIGVILGTQGAFCVLAACLLAPLLLLPGTMLFLDYNSAVLLLTVGVYAAVAFSVAVLFKQGPQLGADVFRLVALACVLFIAGWLASI